MNPLLRFFALTLLWLALLVAAWWPVARWVAHPAGVIAHIALDFGARDWVRSVSVTPGLVSVETRLTIMLPQSGGRGDLIVEAQPQRYGYGLPLFLALLLAAGGRNRLGHALAGYVLLLPFQAFSLVATLLKEIVVAVPGGAPALRITQWQLEAIAYGYQLGSLLLPTLVPIVLWLLLDRGFPAARLIGERLRRTPAPDAPVERGGLG